MKLQGKFELDHSREWNGEVIVICWFKIYLRSFHTLQEAEVKYAQAAQLNPTDPRPILATGRMLASPLIDVSNERPTNEKISRKVKKREHITRGI